MHVGLPHDVNSTVTILPWKITFFVKCEGVDAQTTSWWKFYFYYFAMKHDFFFIQREGIDIRTTSPWKLLISLQWKMTIFVQQEGVDAETTSWWKFCY